MNRWFRHYLGLTADPKFGGIARRSKATKERVVFVWCCLLESAADRNDGGRYGIDADSIADLLGCDTADIEAILTQIEAVGLTTGGCVSKWSDRQFESDTSASRTRRYRERKRHGDEDVTSQAVTATTGDVTVTAPETETDTDNASYAPNGASEAAPAAPPEPPSRAEREPPEAAEPSTLSLKDRCWIDGKLMLVEMHVPEKQAGRMIGKWLRDTGGDHGRVLWAIGEARRAGSDSPIGYVRRLLADVPSTPPQPRARSPSNATSKDGITTLLRELEGRKHERDHDDSPTGPARAPDRDRAVGFAGSQRGGMEGGTVLDLQPIRAVHR